MRKGETFINNFYIADLNINEVRPTKFNFGNYRYHTLFSEETRFGDCIMVQTHDFTEGKLT